MPDEAGTGHVRSVLVVGDAGSLREALVGPLRQAGWRMQLASDVYAAAVKLLRPVGSGPAALAVLVESLRGDELRFFEMAGRRWPAMPVAAVFSLSGQDRRLEPPRRRAVRVVPVEALPEWLMGLGGPAGGLEQEPLEEPGEAAADLATGAGPPRERAVEPGRPSVAAAVPEAVGPPEAPEVPAARDEPEDQPQPDEPIPQEIPIAPWSGKPRAVRQRPRGPAAGSPTEPAESSDGAAEAAPRQDSLLTPEELKALLGDAQEADGAAEELA